MRNYLIILLISVVFFINHMNIVKAQDEVENDVSDEEEQLINETVKKGFFDFLKNHSCPVIAGQENFDVDKFLGRWYEKFRSKKLGRAYKECNTKNYTRREADDMIEVIDTSQ